MKKEFILILAFLSNLSFGQNAPLNSFYNKKGQLHEDTNYVLNKYDFTKDILKNEDATIKKLLDEISYAQLAIEAGIAGKIIIIISFNNGIANDIDYIARDLTPKGLLFDSKQLKSSLSIFKLNQKNITKLFIPVLFTIDDKNSKIITKTNIEIHAAYVETHN